MPIPIPIGTKHIAAVRGAVWKLVTCEQCQQRYAYLLELEATGEDLDLLFLDGAGSAARAQANAESNLVQKSRNVVLPVPCPNCGYYQQDMAHRLKNEAAMNELQIVGAVLMCLSFVSLAFDAPDLWILTTFLAVSGVAVLAWGYVCAFRFDPNAGDPEPRKALGRTHAVWGEPLEQLLTTNPPAEPAAAPKDNS